MNDLDIHYLQLAYASSGGKKRPSADELVHKAESLWVLARNASIEKRAQTTLQRVPEARLRHLVDVVYDLVLEHIEEWEWPDEDSVPYWVAYGLVCLRWSYRERQGREPVLGLTVFEVEGWLQGDEETQLTLLPNW